MAVGVTSYRETHGMMLVTSDHDGYFHKLKDSSSSEVIKRLYHADNLLVLKELVNDDNIKGKVKLIYIDPPYNTGADFECRDQQFAYSDRFSRKEYLSFMEQRLVLMREILSDDGSIYVHLDSKMVFHVKILMDDIFGEDNFKGMITRKKCKSKNYTKKTFGNISDYILFYTKAETPTWNRPYEAWSTDKELKEYPFVEPETGRRYKRVPIHAPGVRNGATGSSWRGMLPPSGKHWQYTPDKLDEMDANNEIYWSSNGNPRRKVYLDESKGIPVQDIWLDFLDINNQNTYQTGYPTEKNLDMIKRIIEASSNKGDLVLDCFAGSGTTLVAANDLERQWIGVDIGDVAIATIQNRLANGSKKLSQLTSEKPMEKSLFDDWENHSDDDSKLESSSVTYDYFEYTAVP